MLKQSADGSWYDDTSWSSTFIPTTQTIFNQTINGKYRIKIERASTKGTDRFTVGIDGFTVEANGDTLNAVKQDAEHLYKYAQSLTKVEFPAPCVNPDKISIKKEG